MGVLAQVVLPRRSGLAKDSVVNTYAIGGASSASPAGDLTDIAEAIYRIYIASPAETPGSSFSFLYMAGCLSNAVDGARVKLYDISAHLDGSPHGSPFMEVPFTLDTFSSAGSLPAEVACVATLEAVGRGNQLVERPDGIDPGFAPDRPRSRYTGRVFIGPLRDSSDVMTLDVNKEARISSALSLFLRRNIRDAAQSIHAIDPTYFLGVWSRADEAIRSIDNVAVDDAPDTQRRRGCGATTRQRTAVSEGVGVELAA